MPYYRLPRKETHILVWEEDDAPVPDKEHITKAWKRLYNEEFPLVRMKWPDWPEVVHKGLWVLLDFGDCTVAEFTDGRVVVKSYDCDQIWELKDGKKKANKAK